MRLLRTPRRGAPNPGCYLDTNAVSTLYRPGADNEEAFRRSVRMALKHQVRTRRLRLVTSGIELQELTGLVSSDAARYRKTIRLLLQLAGRFVLLPMSDLWRLEYRLGARAPESRRYVGKNLLGQIRRSILDPKFAADVFGEADAAARQFAEDERARRSAVLDRFKAYARDDPARAVRSWWQNGDVEGTIDDWTRGSLRAQVERRGGDPRGVPEDFDPRRVPSVRDYHVYKMARIALNVGEGRRIRPSDAADADHYVCASYADIFVTDDQDLRATCDAIPGTAVRPIGLEEFAKRFLD